MLRKRALHLLINTGQSAHLHKILYTTYDEDFRMDFNVFSIYDLPLSSSFLIKTLINIFLNTILMATKTLTEKLECARLLFFNSKDPVVALLRTPAKNLSKN